MVVVVVVVIVVVVVLPLLLPLCVYCERFANLTLPFSCSGCTAPMGGRG
jgi:hypothetical protein